MIYSVHNCFQCFSVLLLLFKMPHLYLPCLTHYFLSTFLFGKEIIPSHFATALLVWEDGHLLSWTNNLKQLSFPEVCLISDLLEIYNDLWSLLFSSVIFLLEIRHSNQTDTSAVLTVGEGQFYVTCKCLPYFCVLVFIFFGTVYCKNHRNTIACMVLNLWNAIAPRSTSVELMPVIPSCLLQPLFVQLVILT